ncbi:MAG: FliA/WhiG family RNA polymerase sigma factor [Candidatus Melainabacteria bacterium]|nr:FliA/WhiG family RNA polymerase sigma factor [Candidatus Melainabacteria bacterium]
MDLKDLKRNEERSLSRIVQAQEKNKKNICRGLNKSVDRDKFIRKYAYLVNWVVGRLPVASLKGLERDDLIGYGTIGLIEAIDRFDPTKGTNFKSFAITRIRGSIYDQLRASDWLTRGSRKRVKNLYNAINELETKLGRHPNDKEIAKELSISLQELRAIQQESQIGIYSLDEPRDNATEGSACLIDNVSSNATPVLEELEESELKEQLIKAIESLPEREKTIVGLYHYKKFTFKEIAEVMDFSESRASQIHARAISLLKSKLLKD